MFSLTPHVHTHHNMRVAGHNSEYSIITLQPIHSYIKFESLAVSLVSLASLNPHSTSLRSDPSDGIFFRVRRTRRQNQQARGLIQFEIARATLVFNKIIHLQKKSNKKRFSVTKRQDTHTRIIIKIPLPTTTTAKNTHAHQH